MIAFLIVYTIVLGLLELQFHFTVGDIVAWVVRLLLGGF